MQISPTKPKGCIPRWPLWSLLWRLLILGPVLMTIGLCLLVGMIASMIAPPVYAISLVVGGDFLLGLAVLAGWVLWLPWGCRLWRWMMQGQEYAGL
jgi:hypothetical protein